MTLSSGLMTTAPVVAGPTQGAHTGRLAAGLLLAQAHAMALAFINSSVGRIASDAERTGACLSASSRANSWTLPSISVDGWQSRNQSPRSAWSPRNFLRSKTNPGGMPLASPLSFIDRSGTDSATSHYFLNVQTFRCCQAVNPCAVSRSQLASRFLPGSVLSLHEGECRTS